MEDCCRMAHPNDTHRIPAVQPTFGRDELNLIDFPIGVLSFKQPLDPMGNRLSELVFTVSNYDNTLGEIVPKRLTTRTSSRHGFPTPKEEQLLIGLMLLTRVKNNFTHPRVEFRPGELYSLMDWPNDSTSKRQLRVGLDRLQGVNLKYENSWTRSGKDYEKEFSTGILDSYQITTLKSGQSAKSALPCWIQWSAEVFTDIQSGNVKELNTQQFFSLKYPLSRRMYRFLDKHLSKSTKLEINLHDFAAHLGVSEKRHVGKIKERLRKPIRELESIPGFIRAIPFSERYQKQARAHWTVVFERESENPTRHNSRKTKTAAKNDNSPASKLVSSFHELWSNNLNHVPAAKELSFAESLIEQHGAQNCLDRLPRVAKDMKQQFPDAAWFGASRPFWNIEFRRRDSIQNGKSVEIELAKAEENHSQRLLNQKQRKQELRRIWQQLNGSEIESIRSEVSKNGDATVQRKLAERKFDDALVELACHRVLESRIADGSIVI